MSFTEVVVLLLLAIVVVGPRQLPGMMRKAGGFIAQGRRWLFDMRAQSGIDEILRNEGLERDIREFRALMKGNVAESLKLELGKEIDKLDHPQPAPGAWALESSLPSSESREFPEAGCDAYGAVAEDLDPYLPLEASRTGDE
jgi:sec-independent protein translocase protein TatB